MSQTVWIIGAGILSAVYVDVLRDLGYSPLIVGRGRDNAKKLNEEKQVPVIQGGLEAFLATRPELPVAACVVTGVEALSDTAGQLVDYGVRDILCEKPGALNEEGLKRLAAKVSKNKARCIIGYNRRCYSATQTARRMLAKDGGVSSFSFEFTEWSDRLRDLKKAPGVLEAFGLGNSSHVMDLAFFLGGWPQDLTTHVKGKNVLHWHPAGSAFAGSGVSTSGAVFSYIANWDAPGRWGVEVMSRNLRMIFRPMEELHIVRRGSVRIEKVEIDDAIDCRFKHGIHLQLQRFLAKEDDDLCKLEDQLRHWRFYAAIAGYT